MLEELLSINPALYNQLIKKLVDWCQLIEHRHNAVSGSYGFRKIRPDDSGMSGEYNRYSYTFSCKEKSYAFNNDDYSRVPTANAWMYFGWVCKLDLGKNGYLAINHNGVDYRRLPSSIVYEQQHPKHIYFDVQGIKIFQEQDLVNFIIYNDFDIDLIGEVYPILYRIAPKNALTDYDIGMEIDWKDTPMDMDIANTNHIERKQLSKIENIISEVRDMYRPFDYVKVKDNPFTSHTELKSRLDPSMKNYLENLKNGKVCPYCGERIFSNSRFCLGCGCPIDYDNEKENLYKELNVEDGKKNL